MGREIVRIPFKYGVSILPKRKRKELGLTLLGHCDVGIDTISPQEAPPVVAVWRPRPDELDGEPIEFRKDALGFLMPLLPGHFGQCAKRPSAPEFLDMIRGDGWKSTFEHHPISYEYRYDKNEVVELAKWPGHRMKTNNEEKHIAFIVRKAASLFIIGDQVFQRTREPALHHTWDLSAPRITVDVDSTEEIMRGTYFFRMTSLQRAIEAMMSSRPRQPAPTLPDLDILIPSAFELDDETPRLCSDLIDTAEAYARQRRWNQEVDAEQSELCSLVFQRSSRGYNERVYPGDPRIPRITEILRAAIASGKICDENKAEAEAALRAWDMRPFDVGGGIPSVPGAEIDLPPELVT